MDIVPFQRAVGDNPEQSSEAEANRYFLQLLQENTQVNFFVNDVHMQQALEMQAERRHHFVLDHIYREANAHIAHLEVTADANHRQQIDFVRQSTMVLVGQLHNETRVLENIAHSEQAAARSLQNQLERTEKECHDERSSATQLRAHLEAAVRTHTAENRQHEHVRTELRTAFDDNRTQLIEYLGHEFEEKLQWEENECNFRLTSEEQQYDSLIVDLEDRNAELIAEVNSLRSILPIQQQSPPQGGAMPVNVVSGESAAEQSSPPQGGVTASGAKGSVSPWAPSLPNPREIPQSLQGVLGRTQRFNIGEPQEPKAPGVELSAAELSELKEPANAKEPKETAEILVEALKSAIQKPGDDDKPKAKEAETVKLPDFPNPETYRSWKITVREAVRAASDRPDEAFKWVQEVYTIMHWRILADLEKLRETGKFLTLDTKILSSLSRVARGDLGRQIINYKESEAAAGRAVRGRQVLLMFEHYFKTNEEAGSLYSVEDLLKVQLSGDDLATFIHNWESVIAGLNHQPEETTLRDILLRQLRCSGKLKFDLEVYDRAKEGTEKRTYEYLVTCVKDLLARDRTRNNRKAIAKAHGAKFGAPAPSTAPNTPRGRSQDKPCYAFQRGKCPRGDTCPYKHVKAEQTRGRTPPRNPSKGGKGGKGGGKKDTSKIPCIFYPKGTCKYKGRSVFQGNKVLDENADHALFAEMSSSPASMEAGKILDAFGSQPGYVIQQADAKQAYTQALFQGVATWVRLPRNRWPKEWQGMKDPIVPLKLALYGHPDSGGIWERHCEKELKKVGFEAVLTDIWKSVFYHPKKKLLLVVYVDDFKLAGPKATIKEGWDSISSVIDMDLPEVIGRYFGCMHKEEHNLTLPKEAHPFRHVFEPEPLNATPARTEDYWDIDPENLLAIRHHHYPRKRLYVPNEDDAQVFPGIGPRRYTVVAKATRKSESEEVVVDDCNKARDRCLKDWWNGETYFDLAGRGQSDFELAVAATRKGKPIRNKSVAKKEVKHSKFITPSQDQKEKPGAMTKPVTRITYDMRDFLDSCVDRYCELAKVDRKSLKPAATPFHELRVALPTASEGEKAGRLQPIASKVLMKILFAARMARWDLLRATQSLASRVTKWSPDCDLGLHRLVSYINSSLDTMMSGFIGDSIMDCRLWLFSDSDYAGEFDSKSTTGCAMFLVGPNTYFPLNAFSKKQTSITMSSTESEVVAANHGLRAEGLPCLSLWYFLWRGDAGRKAEPRAEKGDGIVARIDPELDEIRYGTTRPDGVSIADINGLRVQLPQSFEVRHMEDNQATITLLLLGQAGVLRHTDRTQRVSFSWLKQQYESGQFKLLNVGTSEQTADVFTKPFTEKTKWMHALKLIGHTTSTHAGCKPVSKSEIAKVSVAATSDGIVIVEEFARKALESKDFTFETFESLAELIRVNLKASMTTMRALIKNNKPSTYLVFGAWVHGGCYGVTKRTEQHPWVCKYVNAFIERSSPKGFTWTSFVFNFNGKARLHTDKYNQKESYNLTFSFGDYTGGALWIEGASKLGKPATFEDEQGRVHRGYDCVTYRKPTLLHPSTKHGVQPYEGDRHSFIAYSSGGYQKFKPQQIKTLRQATFSLPQAQLQRKPQSAMVCLKSCVCSPLDEGGRDSKRNKLFSRFENDSFAHTSIECTNTQEIVSRDKVIMTSLVRVLAKATFGFSSNRKATNLLAAIMATIIVNDQFCTVNSARLGMPSMTKWAKMLLQASALSSDVISLGAGHECDMLETAYQCVSTQCASGVSLTHADATTMALRELANLNDDGMGKLQPTARLSPEKRAVIVVSDSSTALCKKNRKGAFMKSDIDNEINMATFVLGWDEYRYTMCWGKTLAWLTWQIEEHVKEIRQKHPNIVIDIICWWCGNEISGKWGCIPTRLGVGLPFRDATTSTEDVARKIRGSADVLAALAGEPYIGFVKVVGNVDADLFQLHSAYNDFNEAMFTEFRARGLQVQSATPFVEKLEMYDSFHASEDDRNRKLFSSYIHATLNLSRGEWMASKLVPCVRALRAKYEHVEKGDEPENPVLAEVFAQWNAEKAEMDNPKPKKLTPISELDRAWEAPDAASAIDVSNVSTNPPLDKAIRKDVPRLAANTDVSDIARHANDVVTHDEEGKVSYDPPETVVLVDEGDYENPISSSIGRVVEPAPKLAPRPKRASDMDEDTLRRHMYIDESAPQGAATVDQLPNEYFYNGRKHLLKPFNPEDIIGDKDMKFRHGDLKFLTMLLRGHELEAYPLVFDRGCWTDVDSLLSTFNQSRGTRWGVRQLLRAAKADKKGRIRLLGIEVPMRETIGQPLFPVRVRMSQGHNEKLVGKNPDSDHLLASKYLSDLSVEEAEMESSVRGVTVLSKNDTPAKLYHRTNEKGMSGILREGMIPGSARSNRAHNYLSPYRLDEAKYMSGMRSNQPIEMVVDTIRAIEAGCTFFITETDGVLTRDIIPPDCIMTATDTSKKDKPLYVAKGMEATREGEPFRAKRDYQEAAASSTDAAPRKPVAAKRMPGTARRPTLIDPPKAEDVVMSSAVATRKGEPAKSAGDDSAEIEVEVEVDEGDTTDAGEEERYPLGSHPCAACQAVVANGMLFCLKCGAPQTDETAKSTKRFFENAKLRKRILAAAASGNQKPIDALLCSDLRGGDGSKKRGQMSAEAAVIREAKDRRSRATKLSYSSISQRWEQDDQFRSRMMEEGRNLEDMQKFDHMALAVLPDPGRTEEQRHLRAGAHYYTAGTTPGVAPAKLVFFAHCEVEPLRTLKFIDDNSDVPIGVTYMGAFLNPKLFAEIALANESARRILTFDGEVHLDGTSAEMITSELATITGDSLPSAEGQRDMTERLAEQNRQVAARNRASQGGRDRGHEPLYQGYTQSQWDEWNRTRRQRQGQYTQAEWDAWNRSRRY